MQGGIFGINLVLFMFASVLLCHFECRQMLRNRRKSLYSLCCLLHVETPLRVFSQRSSLAACEKKTSPDLHLLYSYLTSGHVRHFPPAVHLVLGENKSSDSQGHWYCFVSFRGSLFLQPDFLDVLLSLMESKNSICERLTSPGILGETKQRLVWVDIMSHFYD